ncbi:nucleotidyltransferase domain-containing protein [bacterium]|nr:nucleotidyltransferase domain-containing protein [bacterium]
MPLNVPDRVLRDIKYFAQKNGVKKVILFGSRARGTNRERSDIDIAVSGGNYLDFYDDINERAYTLLMFDIVDLDRTIGEKLQSEIDRDGILIYGED